MRVRFVPEIGEKCFGVDHVVTLIAERSPWVLLEKIPFEIKDAPRRVMEIVKDFKDTDGYIV